MNILLDKEWYTVKETSEILGIKSNRILERINRTKKPVNKIKECEYKKEKGKYLIHRDYITRITEKEWLSIGEACQLIGKSEPWLRKKIENGEISRSLYSNDGLMLINKKYITEIKKEVEYIEEMYFSYLEASNILGKSVPSISGLVKRGIFKDVIQSTAGSFVSKKEILWYKEIIEETISTSIIQTDLNLSLHQVLEFIKKEPRIISNNISGNNFYIKKDSYQNFKEELVYTVEMAGEYLKTTTEAAKVLIEKKYVKGFNVEGLGLRTSKFYLDEYIKEEHIPLVQLTMEMNIKTTTLNRYIHIGELKTKKVNGQHFIHRDEGKRFKNSLSVIKLKYFDTDQYDNLLEDVMNYFLKKSKYSETVKLFEVWSKKCLWHYKYVRYGI